jgi:hypothetical protein
MKKIYYAFLLIITIVSACKKDQLAVENKTEISADVIQKLKAAGFDTSEGLTKINGGYMVEYDIFMSDSSIDKLEAKSKVKIPLSAKNIQGKIQSKDLVSHYRSNNLVLSSWNSQRNIQVYMDPAFGTYLQNALDSALQRYNDLDLNVTFTRTNNASANDIYVSSVSNKSYLMSAGFPYGNGEPYDEILVNIDYYNSSSNRADAISTFAHEIGHCIGFRHNDYMNRSFSCNTGGNEGSTSSGAIYMPGTTSSPHAGSWMLACSDGFDRPFTLDDILAIKSIYSYTKNIYVKEVLSLVSYDSGYSAYDDWEKVEWGVVAEFYQDANKTIPYTTSANFVLNTNVGSEEVYNPEPLLIPNGVTSYYLGTFIREKYYSYGTLVQDNSSGYRVTGFSGYYGPF